jgi:hypothetical protein
MQLVKQENTRNPYIYTPFSNNKETDVHTCEVGR